VCGVPGVEPAAPIAEDMAGIDAPNEHLRSTLVVTLVFGATFVPA
jgi:hypothetical protein